MILEAVEDAFWVVLTGSVVAREHCPVVGMLAILAMMHGDFEFVQQFL